MTDQLNLKGKSVALVGPAKPVGDQSAEVEACDFVIRCDYRWNGHEPLVGYGQRTDAAFYSIACSKVVQDFPEVWKNLPYVILKESAVQLPHPHIIKTQNPFEHSNQMPILLHWVETLQPAEIHIFGADFYTSGLLGSWQTDYLPNRELDRCWRSVQTHNQANQHNWMKAFQERTGLIKGDSKMVELLSLTTEEVIARLNEAWGGI